MRRLFAFVALLLPLFAFAVQPPVALRTIDLRWVTGQPELETWLGSLQGALNRQPEQTPVFLIDNDTDAAWADALVRAYGLQKEVLTPGALLAQAKPALTGQVLYDPAQPWTRNIALTAAALAPGAAIATDTDLGLPTVQDLRQRWTNRQDAYTWAAGEYGAQASQQEVVLAPESGHLLADSIATRKLLAVDYSPTDVTERAALKALLQRLPAGVRLLGSPDDRCGDADTAFWYLTDLLRDSGTVLVPARDAANLSCFARFPATRPLLQGRAEAVPAENTTPLLIVYDAGSAVADGSQSLDFALRGLLPLLDDPALANLPVAIQVPEALFDYAPAAYQLLIARQRLTSAEFIAAPNGNGWTLPMLMPNADAFLRRAADRGREMDLTAAALFDLGGQQAYRQVLQTLAPHWRGAIVRPVAATALPDRQPRADQVLPGFAALAGVGRVKNADELRTALGATTAERALLVLYVDPIGLPPSALQALLPEFSRSYSLISPSQAFRAREEREALLPYLQQLVAAGRSPRPGRPTLRVGVPTVTATGLTTATPIPVSITATGGTPVLTATLIYRAPDGRLQSAQLHPGTGESWTATLPPMLTGGELTIRARFVERPTLAETVSDPVTLFVPGSDEDKDGADDTLEAYRGSDPRVPDTDADGLPDGLDAHPTHADRDVLALFAPILPPADRPFLANAGTSTADKDGRLLPAGCTVTYRIPLKDLPAAPAALRLVTSGAGTAQLAGDTASSKALSGERAITDVPVPAARMQGADLALTLTAGTAPLRLLSLALLTNPEGPYIRPVRLSPQYPPAGEAITARVMVYSPAGVKTVRLRYGAATTALKTVEMQPVKDLGGVVFSAEIPAQPNGAMLVYGVEAEDADGRGAALPYAVMPIGRTRQHSTALIGTRDLRGSWQPAPIWGGAGRVLLGAGSDTHRFLARPGAYTAWLLAQPRERSIRTTIKYNNSLIGASVTKLDSVVSAGAPDGWTKLGTFTAEEAMRLDITIAPDGDAGYCAYGMLVLTQDPQFTPPLAHAGIDWYNSLTVTGVEDGQTVGDRIVLQVKAAGNIDAITASALQTSGVVTSTQTYAFTDEGNGSFSLDTRKLLPGNYRITVEGQRVVRDRGRMVSDPLVSVTLTITVPQR